MSNTSQVLVTDVRWPRFAAEATRLGVRSMLCTPLAAQDRILGSLSLASAEPHAFDYESMAVAAGFAAHATLAVLNVHQARDLTAMADTRDLIGQAKGILMERFKLSSDAAFQLLLAASQHSNIKLRQICERLADTGELPDVTTPSEEGADRGTQQSRKALSAAGHAVVVMTAAVTLDIPYCRRSGPCLGTLRSD